MFEFLLLLQFLILLQNYQYLQKYELTKAVKGEIETLPVIAETKISYYSM